MRTLLILAVLFFSTDIFAEDKRLSADEKLADLLFPSKVSLKLEQFPIYTSAEFAPIKETILQRLKTDEMCFVINHEETPHAFFHKYDLSGDGIDDVILSSYCGAMEIRNYIWIRKGDSAVFAGFIEGTPLKFYRDNQSGPFLFIASEGWCCAGYVGSVSLYQLQENQGRFEYKIAKKVFEWGGVTIPEKRIVPVQFKVKSEKYSLRYSPEILNEPGEVTPRGEKFIGNIIAEFPRGSRGEAVAEYKDTTDRVWWFVLMDRDAKTITNHFYADEDGNKSGWMSSRYLEIAK